MSAAASHPNWLATVKAHLAADKRKTIALGVLSLVMVFVWGRLFLKSSGPAVTPVASLAPELVAAVSSPEIGHGVDESSATVARGPSPGRATPVIDIRKADRTLSRDFFNPDWNQFALAGGSELAADSKHPAAPGAWERVASSVRRERERRKRESEVIRKQAAALTLQSTIIGRPSSAMISGRLVHVGDVVDGFDIDAIEARAVVVRKDGVRVTIRMP